MSVNSVTSAGKTGGGPTGPGRPAPDARRFSAVCAFVLMLLAHPSLPASEGHCDDYQPGVRNVYWGDLHVHTAYSLDAWGFGTLRTPEEAYGFARGKAVSLPGNTTARLEVPLDFVAVTDHAEWFDLLYTCTDPQWRKDPYCSVLTGKNRPETGIEVFRNYVIPTITGDSPSPAPLCTQDEPGCRRASLSQWERIQDQANRANDPCEFTTFIGYEWSATPGGSHSHRNLIFASEQVTREAIDYIRYPGLDDLFEQLDIQCQPREGCEVLSIPHNTNMGDGTSFDIETESEHQLRMRRRYERLVEIFQEKGSSECLPAFGDTDEEDCGFETRLSRHSRPAKPEDYRAEEWEKMRRTYVRGLLLRGLAATGSPGHRKDNPLQMGIIGSTDNHTATPGYTSENDWTGPVFGIGDLDRAMSRMDWNPGGLVAVWAEENTRSSLFDALRRREVYGTSGPRIRLQFSASPDQRLTCDGGEAGRIRMGSAFGRVKDAPAFRVQALYDEVPLVRVEIIKGEYRDGRVREQRFEIWSRQSGGIDVCIAWQDPDFDASAPAFWYPRVFQAPTPRWSAVQCRKAGRCEDYPAAVQTVQERAWGSPVWYLPE